MKVSNPTARIGEQAACDFLKRAGFKILERNFRKGYGEIDIIGIDKDTLVFIEVKTRTGKQFGEPEESITPFKIRSLIKTSQFYKILNSKTPDLLRIDAVIVTINGQRKINSINHIKNIS